ncbi:hypothetical protein LXEBMM8_EKPBGFGD_00305 [Lactiplantibacillus xiangfangensis]
MALCMVVIIVVLNKNSATVRVAVIDGDTGIRTTNIRHKRYVKGSHSSKVHADIVINRILKGLYHNKDIIIYDYAVMDSDGGISEANFQKALMQARKDHAQIINFSGGFDVTQSSTHTLIRKLVNEKVVIVAAAGNNYGANADFPADVPGVVSVGSTANGTRADYSARGKVDVYCNGSNIQYKGNRYYGTSFAAPQYTNRLVRERLGHPKKAVWYLNKRLLAKK